MKIKPTGIEGLIQIEPDIFQDERGFFLESYNVSRYNELGIKNNFVQDNHSRSYKNILRGLHYQINNSQAQIVYVSQGRIFDVAVDLRPLSKTFKKNPGSSNELANFERFELEHTSGIKTVFGPTAAVDPRQRHYSSGGRPTSHV